MFLQSYEGQPISLKLRKWFVTNKFNFTEVEQSILSFKWCALFITVQYVHQTVS